MPPAAYHGLAGEVVAAHPPHTESDPVALLLQYLDELRQRRRAPATTTRSKALSISPTCLLAGGQHVAMSRKGTRAEHIRRIIRNCRPDWARDTSRRHQLGRGHDHAIRDPVYGMKKGVEEMIDPGVADKRLLFDEREFSSR